ncbi:MAG: phosphatase PAP2 family protein [Candidatus Altiarchaeota archaeon]
MQKLHLVVDKIPEFPYFLLAFAYMFLHPGHDYIHIFAVAFLFVTTSLAIGITLKLVCKTQRPVEYTTIKFFKYGFPSLHSMISLGAIAFLLFLDGYIALLLLPVGAFYVYSRIRMRFHTAHDVIGGAILGLSVGAIFGYYGFGMTMPHVIEFMFAVLFFVLPISFSIARVRMSV